MRLASIMGNSQKLDGGAMFGNVPKALWAKWISPDQENRIHLTCRALLVEVNNKRILFETGIGSFFSPDLKNRYGIIEENHVLLASLEEKSISHEDIDFVILSHLHFDHAGGLLSPWHASNKPTLLFPNAQYIIGAEAWSRAINPHYRDKASFIPELNKLLEQSGRVILVEGERCEQLGQDFRFFYTHGHTPGMMLTEINTPDSPIIFAADLIPGKAWVHLPVTMGYDRFPEHLIDEKKELLEYIVKCGGKVFFTHDPEIALADIIIDEKGKFLTNNEKEYI